MNSLIFFVYSLDKKTREYNKTNAALNAAESRLSDLSSMNSQLQADKGKLADEIKVSSYTANILTLQRESGMSLHLIS